MRRLPSLDNLVNTAEICFTGVVLSQEFIVYREDFTSIIQLKNYVICPGVLSRPLEYLCCFMTSGKREYPRRIASADALLTVDPVGY